MSPRAQRIAAIDSEFWRRLSLALATLALAGAGYLAVLGRLADAAILSTFVVASFALALWRDVLPPLFAALFTTAAAINAAGYVFDLWRDPIWFDEAVHVLTPFVIVAAAGWLLIARNLVHPRANRLPYFLKILAIGLLIGLAWEGFEFLIGIVGSRLDSLIDLAMDLLGSLLAAAFCLHTARREPPPATA